MSGAGRGLLDRFLGRTTRERELERQVKELQTQVALLLAENARLGTRVRELEARLGQNSQNSSWPPSLDPPGAPKRPPKPPTGRRPGGQPGHKGKTREMVPAERVDQTIAVKPPCCQWCGAALTGDDPHPDQRQVIGLPQKIRAWITEYLIHTLECERCGRLTKAPVPDEAQWGFDAPLTAMVALLSGVYHLSRRNVEAILGDLLVDGGENPQDSGGRLLHPLPLTMRSPSSLFLGITSRS